MFIHDAVAEAIVCGDTEVAAARLHGYVGELLAPRPNGTTQLETQFKVSGPPHRHGNATVTPHVASPPQLLSRHGRAAFHCAAATPLSLDGCGSATPGERHSHWRVSSPR